MIEYIHGILTELTPTNAVIECAGVGYDILITLSSYDLLQESIGCETKLYIFEVVREDSFTLYGFPLRLERTMFSNLISVSGVGPSTGRLILSAMKPETVQECIETGNDAALKSVKGVGAKTAQRIIVDLRGKMDGIVFQGNNVSGSKSSFDDALKALVTLGFSQQLSAKALKKLLLENPNLSAEQAIKEALKLM